MEKSSQLATPPLTPAHAVLVIGLLVLANMGSAWILWTQAAAALYQASFLGDDMAASVNTLYVLMVVVALACWYVIEVGGRVLGAKLVGFDVFEIKLFTLLFTRIGGRWHRRSTDDRSPFWVQFGPIDAYDLQRRAFTCFLFSPAIGIVFSSSIAFVLLISPHVEPTLIHALAGLGGGLIVCSLWSLLALPSIHYSYTFYTGRMLWRLASNQRKSETAVAFWGLERDAYTVRPRDWNSDLILKTLDGVRSERSQAHAARNAFFWHLDRGEIDDATALLPFLLHGLVNHIYDLEGAYILGRYENNPGEARKLYEQGVQVLKPIWAGTVFDRDAMFARAEAAVLLSEGAYEQAIAVAAKGLHANSRIPEWTVMKVFSHALEDWLNDLITEAQCRRDALVAASGAANDLPEALEAS